VDSISLNGMAKFEEMLKGGRLWKAEEGVRRSMVGEDELITDYVFDDPLEGGLSVCVRDGTGGIRVVGLNNL
jgi:hypothetical protein